MSEKKESMQKLLKEMVKKGCDKKNVDLLLVWIDNITEYDLENILKIIYAITKEVENESSSDSKVN